MDHLHRAGPVALAWLFLVAGCGDNGGQPDGGTIDLATKGDMATGGDGGGGGMLSATPSTTGGDYQRPLDAVPSPDGATIYFTANHLLTGGDVEPAVFSVAASGGSATVLASGAPLVGPFGIALSSDGKTLYLADAASANANQDDGAVFTLPSAGGLPALLGGSAGLKPRGLDVHAASGADTLYLSGTDPASGQGAIYTLPASGGAATQLATGLGDPGGLAVDVAGNVYLADTAGADDRIGQVVKVQGGAASSFVGDLPVGYPAGIALTSDEKSLLVSGIDPETNGSVVYLIDLATQKVEKMSSGIGSNSDSGGLHRARSANVFAWAGVTAGASGQGIVYRVNFN